MTLRDDDDFMAKMRRKAAECDMNKRKNTTVRLFGGPLCGEERVIGFGTPHMLTLPIEKDMHFFDFDDPERGPTAFMPQTTTYEFKGWKESTDGTYARYEHRS